MNFVLRNFAQACYRTKCRSEGRFADVSVTSKLFLEINL